MATMTFFIYRFIQGGFRSPQVINSLGTILDMIFIIVSLKTETCSLKSRLLSEDSQLLRNDVGNSSEALSSKQTTINIGTNKQLVTKAEIIWALDVVMSKYLFNSSSNKSDLFTTTFPDSGIAKNFSCGQSVWVDCQVWDCTLLC